MNEWSAAELKILEENFANHSNKELSDLIGRSWTAIATKARELKLYKTHNHKSKMAKIVIGNEWSAEEEKKLIEMYPNHSVADLIKVFGRTYDSLRSKAREFGVVQTKETLLRTNRDYTANHSFFSSLNTPEKAYALGFIFADGNLHNNRLRIILQARDEFLLFKLRNILDSTHPLLYRNNYTEVGLEIRSPQIYEDLIKLGVKPNKTYLDDIPKIPIDLYRHFLRGLFDGDGTIRITFTKGQSHLVSITNSINMCQDILEKTRSILGVGGGVYIKSPNGFEYAHWDLGGNKQVQKFVKYIYKSANSLFLNRKYMKFVEAGLI